jgi:alkylation response protein AidB-like acyl-CoA dehydrogenase
MIVCFDETQEMLRETAREVCSAVRGTPRLTQAARAQLWRKFGELGWTGVALGEAFGGSGGSLLDAGLIALELGRGGVFCGYPDTIALSVMMGALAAPPAALLEGVAAGRIALALAMKLDDMQPLAGLEPGTGGDFAGKGLLTEQAAAETVLVEFVVDPEPRLVAVAENCLVARPVATTTRQGDRLVDLRASVAGLGDDAVLLRGPEAVVAWARVKAMAGSLSCAQLVGAGRQFLDMSVEYAGLRVQFGRPVGTFQAVQHALAETLAACDAAELTTFKALAACDRGADAGNAAVVNATGFVREAVWSMLMKSYDILGGVGYMEEHPFSRYARGLLPMLASLGTAEQCDEQAGHTVRKGAWLS